MQRNLIAGILGIAIISLMSVALVTALWPDHAVAGSVHRLHQGFGYHGDACARLDAKHSRLLSAYLEISLDLDDAQSHELANAVAVLDDWRAATQLRCATFAVATLPEALTELKEALTDAQQAIEQLQPHMESFYSTLSAEQRATLNGWAQHHHGTES